MRSVRASASAVACAALLAAPAASAAGYEELRARAVAACRAIDPAESQSGLLFNPDGYRSYYVRSECLQRTAVEFRDEALCAEVEQRRAWFSSSWGISRRRCRELVGEGVAADRAELEEAKRRYASGGMRLREFRVEGNGNGRDFDVIPSFQGDEAHGYALRLEAVGAAAGGGDALLHESGYYVDASSQLRIFVREEEIRQRIPGFALGRPYTVRLTLVLDVGSGGPGGYWSDAFIESVFPAPARSQSAEREVRF